ncbi:MAG: energy transducer TonB, partial [Pseudomonadota bacterium]
MNKTSLSLGLTISASLVLHLIILCGFSSVVMFKTLTVSELTIQNLSESPSRIMPSPRSTPKSFSNLEATKNIKNLKLDMSPPVQPARPTCVQSPQSASSPAISGITAMGEGIDVPAITGLSAGDYGFGNTSGPMVTAWNPGNFRGNDTGGFVNAQSYFEMIRLKIERHKAYPDKARLNHVEGRVTVRFAITSLGNVHEVKVIRSSRNKSLDQAAIDAVQKSAPFSRPPVNLFKQDIPFEITIHFELNC